MMGLTCAEEYRQTDMGYRRVACLGWSRSGGGGGATGGAELLTLAEVCSPDGGKTQAAVMWRTGARVAWRMVTWWPQATLEAVQTKLIEKAQFQAAKFP